MDRYTDEEDDDDDDNNEAEVVAEKFNHLPSCSLLPLLRLLMLLLLPFVHVEKKIKRENALR